MTLNTNKELELEFDRLEGKIRIELGPHVLEALRDPDVTEIMLNPDGSLWKESRKDGMGYIGPFSAVNAKALIGTIAHSLGTVATADNPIIEGALIVDGSRFEGVMPPCVANPTWTIRKRADHIFPLSDYVNDGLLSYDQAEKLRTAIKDRRNILVAGGTGSGKTTFTNALINEIVDFHPQERLIILEDTPELQCAGSNHVFLLTSLNVSMNDLLRTTMRLRPDRILVGEVRDGAALDLLKSWNTGHPGGIATIHATSAESASLRMCQLAAEALGQSHHEFRDVVDSTLDLVVLIERRRDGSRSITDIHEVSRG